MYQMASKVRPLAASCPFPVFSPDRAAADRSLLTFTSTPLDIDFEVTGEPIAHVFLATANSDDDVIVLLEEVTADGQVNYVTEGELRAGHRANAAPPYRTLPPPP
jgi:predicted acyl esterase